jgi:hypothetical protein
LQRERNGVVAALGEVYLAAVIIKGARFGFIVMAKYDVVAFVGAENKVASGQIFGDLPGNDLLLLKTISASAPATTLPLMLQSFALVHAHL